MITKLVYILIFALADFILYSKLNKTAHAENKWTNWFTAAFLIFSLLHIFNWPFLIERKYFGTVLFTFLLPIFSHLFFKYLALPRIFKKRNQGMNENFVNFMVPIFSFFFLKLVFAMAFLAQCEFILDPSN